MSQGGSCGMLLGNRPAELITTIHVNKTLAVCLPSLIVLLRNQATIGLQFVSHFS